MSSDNQTPNHGRWNAYLTHATPHLVYLITLAALAIVGMVDHSLHWTLPGFDSHGESDSHAGTSGATSLGGHRGSENHTDVRVATDQAVGSPTKQIGEVNRPNSALGFANHESIRKSGLQIEQASYTTMSKDVIASAEVEYDRFRTVDLSSRVAGVVYRSCVKWGQYVEKGQILAIVDSAEVGRLKSEFARALFERNLKQKSLERYQGAGEAIPLRLVLEAEGALQAANVQLLSAEQALINLGLSVCRNDYEGMTESEVINRLRTIGFDGPVSKDIELETASSNLLPVRSPIDGVVIGNDCAMGESLSPDRAFLQVSDVSRVWITLDIRKEDASAIRLGQPVEFLPDGHSDSVTGVVTWISTEVDEKTRTLHVRTEVENPRISSDAASPIDGYMLRANMFGTGRVQVKVEHGIAVSKDCIHNDNGQSVVFVRQSDASFVPRVVQVGITSGRLVQVRGDLEHGCEVAAAGSQMLKSQMSLARLQGD